MVSAKSNKNVKWTVAWHRRDQEFGERLENSLKHILDEVYRSYGRPKLVATIAPNDGNPAPAA